MDTNAKVPPAPPVTEPQKAQTKPDPISPAAAPSETGSQTIPAYIAEPADYRLVIDKDPVSGAFVYRTVDRSTGEIVAQFPSEAIMRLRDSADYKAGTVFSGKV